MELDRVIKTRRSVRKFSHKTPNWRDILEAIDSARFAPMAGGIYTLKFIVVSDKNTIQKLASATQQPFVGQAQYVVVVCSKAMRAIDTYGEQAEDWVKQQAGAGIQNFLLKLTEKGLSTTWVGYFVEKIVKVILNVPEDVNVEAMFPIGYEIEKPKTKKAKIDLDRILYFEKYDHKRKRKDKYIDV